MAGPVPKAALDFFKAKEIKPAFSYAETYGEEHALAFTVAKIVERDLLKDVQDSLATALEEGQTFEEWQDDIEDTFDESGWSDYNGDAEDSPHRLKTVFDTNMRSARAAGQWDRAQRTKDVMPFFTYVLGPSKVHREEHEEWEGLTLSVDDPFWDEHYPPSDYGCKCRLRQVSQAEAEELGIDEAPETEYEEWENPTTGETKLVAEGVGPTFGVNPGKVRAQHLAELLGDDD
jgi:SPP1 gp7 family putative phage head morphogenesis protein